MADNNASDYFDKSSGERIISMPVVQRVEIAQVLQVESHIVNRFHQTTSHVIRFVGGGICTVVHDAHGGPGEIQARNLVMDVRADGVVTLYWTHRSDHPENLAP